MPFRGVNPAELEGEALRRWYLTSADEIELERQAAQNQRYQAFFGNGLGEPDEAAKAAPQASRQVAERDEGILWMANGSGGYRAVGPGAGNVHATLQPPQAPDYPDYIPANSAAMEAAALLDIGSRENRTLKRFYIEKHGYWPKAKDGRDYEVSHKRAIADGGKNTLDNIEPIHPDEHRPKHAREGDSGRWGKRDGIARAFGGKVEPSRGGPAVRGLGLLGAFTNLDRLLTGQVRNDSFANFALDMMGFPSIETYRRAWEGPKWTTPDCPPGWQCI